MAPNANDRAYKRWTCHSGLKLLCKLCRTSPPPAMGARLTVLGHVGHADPRTTNITQTHRPSSKSERNLNILQVNINGLRNKLDELKLLIHDTHADIITIQETKLTPKAKTPKIHNLTAVRTNRQEVGSLHSLETTLHLLQQTYLRLLIHTTQNFKWSKVHINNTKHITIANIYIPPRDTTSTHYKIADTDIQHCIQYITNRQEVGSLHSLETTLHLLQQTYLRLLIHTTQNFKWSKVHINNTKHITIANIYIPPRDTTSTHYKIADTDIQHCIQYITNIPHSVLTGDVNAHSTLWHSYTDDHRGQLIADVISNSDHITLNTNTPTRVPNTTLQQTSSLDITTVSNTLYNRTSWTTQHALSSDHLPIITTITIRHDYRLQQTNGPLPTTRKQTGHNLPKTHSPLSLRPPYPPTYTLPT